ncbi:MAG: hypothetical protein OK474_07965 [Thaumarchaeota archaeon]|nr:hypothetical protein [Nitrososphaerota archaeon]
MYPDRRNDRHEGPEDRRWTRRRAILLCAAFAAPVLLLVLVGSLFVIPLIYLAVSVEGVFVAFVAISAVRSTNGRMNAEYRGDSSTTNRARPGADRVQTLASYVKWAARGSDFSRRDVARTVMQIAERSHAAPSRGEGVSPNRELPDAIETLVYPYRDDPFVRAGMRTLRTDRAHGDGPATQAGTKGRPPGRARYLASLEEVVSGLERGMKQSGSA